MVQRLCWKKKNALLDVLINHIIIIAPALTISKSHEPPLKNVGIILMKILGTTAQNLVAQTIRRQEFTYLQMSHMCRLLARYSTIYCTEIMLLYNLSRYGKKKKQHSPRLCVTLFVTVSNFTAKVKVFQKMWIIWIPQQLIKVIIRWYLSTAVYQDTLQE